MSSFFVYIYNFFRNRSLLLTILVALLLAAAIYFALKINIDEDILSQQTAGSGQQSPTGMDILMKSKVTEKLILDIYFSPQSTIHSPQSKEELKAFVMQLADSLMSKSFKPFVSAVTYKINDSVIYNIPDLAYSALPLLLEKEDYKKIDSLIKPENISSTLAKDYNNLINPAGFAMKKFILREPLGIASIALNKIKHVNVFENFEIDDGFIMTKDRKNLFLFVDPAIPSNETAKNTVFIDKLDRLINKVSSSNIKVDYYGAAPIAVNNARQVKKDLVLTVGIAILIILIFIAWFFRRLDISFISFLPGIFGGITSLALIFFIKGKISSIGLSIGSVLLGLIVDYALYILSVYRNKFKVQSSKFKVNIKHGTLNPEHSDVMEGVVKDMSLTICLCSLTSAVAFFTLLFVKSEVLRDLGLFAGLSVLSAAFFSLTVMPHIIRSKFKVQSSKFKSNRTIIDKITGYSFENNRWLISGIIVISLIFLFTMKKVGFETDIAKMNYMSKRLREAENRLDKINNVSLKNIYVIATGKNIDEAEENEQRASDILRALKNKDVIKSYSSTSFVLIPSGIINERLKLWNDYWNDSRKDITVRTLTEESKKFGFKKDAFDEFINLLNVTQSPQRRDELIARYGKSAENIRKLMFSDIFTESSKMTTILSVVKLEENQKDKMHKAFADKKNLVVVDKQRYVNSFIDNIKSDFDVLVMLCLVFVTISLIIAFGRIELGVISSLPMFLSWLWTLSIMSLFGIKFTIFNIIITTFIFGLGVDYSILMLRGMMLEFKYGDNELPSYKTSILISAFTTIAGAGVMMMAKHPALNSIGLISIIGLTAVVIISYALVPLLFRALIKTTIHSSQTSEFNNNKKILINRREPITLVDILFTLLASFTFISGCAALNLSLLILLPLPIKKARKQRILHYIMMICCKVLVWVMVSIKKDIKYKDSPVSIWNTRKYRSLFEKPSVILANHQSHIDLLLVLLMNPKIIVLTNKEVWNNKFYKWVIRYLDYYTISDGFEVLIEKLKMKAEEGYSILVFPEGSRTTGIRIEKFYKGGFAIADKLNLDILPVMIHGAGDCMHKGEYFVKRGRIVVRISDRIEYKQWSLQKGIMSSAKRTIHLKRQLEEMYEAAYERMKEEYGTTGYYKRMLLKNYIYKGPVLEWYIKTKLWLEKNYELINSIIPRDAEITDIGCGYGQMDYMLGFISGKRKITGIDYDDKKIKLAANNISKKDNLEFVCSDAMTYEYKESDVFIFSDMLHYLNEENQDMLLRKCAEKLKKTGMLIIRDADKSMKSRHLLSRCTEFFSTRSGFNKMGEKKLFFLSKEMLEHFSEKYQMKLEIIDNKKLTSNVMFVLRKRS